MDKFIDISEYNQVNNYQALASEGLKGAIIKATEGTTFRDSMTETHYEGLKSKLPIGFYHYLTITSHPESQAENFWNTIKDKEFQIIPVLDVEQESLGDSAEMYSAIFIERFKELSGLSMVVYSGRYFIEEHFSSNFKTKNVFWVADYSSLEPEIQDCNIIAWQYTEECTSYPEIKGNVDCSYLYDTSHFYINGETSTSKPIHVLELQKELNKQCFTDNNWDELTEDGIAGELTLSACPLLKIGATGNITRWLQDRLGVTVDGVFGAETRQAVIQFQKSNGLDMDGIVGKETWRKLLGM